jgi:hypothetical protein
MLSVVAGQAAQVREQVRRSQPSVIEARDHVSGILNDHIALRFQARREFACGHG